jgi:hypothetical protein
MAEERVSEITMSEEDLNTQPEKVAGVVDQENKLEGASAEVYKQDEKKVEQVIERSGEKLQQKTSSTTSSDDSDDTSNVNSDIEYHIDEMKKLDVDDQVDHLVRVATQKSPILAMSIARHLQDNYILNEVHSDLTEDKIRNILDEKGLL